MSRDGSLWSTRQTLNQIEIGYETKRGGAVEAYVRRNHSPQLFAYHKAPSVPSAPVPQRPIRVHWAVKKAVLQCGPHRYLVELEDYAVSNAPPVKERRTARVKMDRRTGKLETYLARDIPEGYRFGCGYILFSIQTYEEGAVGEEKEVIHLDLTEYNP